MMRAVVSVAVLTLTAGGLLWPRAPVRAAPMTGRPCNACKGGPDRAASNPRAAVMPEIAALMDQVRAEDADGHSAPSLRTVPPQKPLGTVEIAALAARCAPSTPVSVVQALVKVESGGRPLLVAVNGVRRRVIAAADLETGRREIDDLRAAGANFDIGLIQLNSATLARLGVSPEQALDPCRNLALGAKLFEQGYARAFAERSTTVPLLAAYSSYNTGDLRRGYTNGYAGRVDAELRSTASKAGSS